MKLSLKTIAWVPVLFSLSPLAAISLARADAADPGTRRVIQGDLVYRASAIAPSEARAVYLAQARAAWMLSVECGAPPREARVYRQSIDKTPDGAFSTTAEVGTPIADCETMRDSPAETRKQFAQPELSRMAALY